VKILLHGMNHRTAPLEVRERFAVDDVEPALRKLADASEVEEAVIVSTCNRVELLVTTREPDAARLRLERFFARELAAGFDGGDLDPYVYELADREAMCHVLRVASSIDSMVVGEPQILGQVKDAYRAAVEAGTCGPVLSRLFQHAFATAKRVRNETAIAERPVSVARVAVDLARQIFEDLDDKQALLVGAGEMIETALEALRGEGLGHVRVANRTRSRAEALAERFAATPHDLSELPTLLAGADVVLTCIGGDGPLISPEHVTSALRGRGHQPLFIIDIGVPRNVDPGVNEIDNAFLYDIDDLQDVAEANIEHRRRETVRAEDIVREEQERFDGWLVALQAVPTIRHLRARAESIREAELQRALSRTRLSDGDRERVEAMTRSIVNKILHAPIARLRDETDREEGLAMLEAARSLFGLDRATPREPASRGSAFHGSAGGEIDSDDEPER
jgi:glutamyl-tRNA reductase